MTTVQDMRDRTHEQTEDHIGDLDGDLDGDLRGSRPPRLPVRAMTFVLLGLAVFAVIAVAAEAIWLRPRHDAVEQHRSSRSAAIAVAQQFTVQWNTFSYTDMDGYQGDVEALMTTRFRSDFGSKFSDVSRLATAAQLTSGEATVLKSGIASLDQDSAQVLVVADATAENVQETRERHFRWAVDLVKVDGRWLVDSFEAVDQGVTR